jgi:prepilin-type N-terminal cleavage/methylation domain-containing protein
MQPSRAFTLIELLVVTAIIALLIGLISPGLARSRAAAKSISCLSKLRTLQLSTRLYADEHRTLPLSEMSTSIHAYDLPTPSWRCSEDRFGLNVPLSTTTYSAYTYLAPLYMDPPPTGIILSRLKPKIGLRKYENNPLLPLFWDKGENHDKDRNIVYWNGVAERGAWNK